MSHLRPASPSSLRARARSMLRAWCRGHCTSACQVDRELMTLRTDLTRTSGWSAAGVQ